MFKLLLNLKGNKRACIWTEPMWSIPFNLYAPFAAVYMFYLGVLDWQIGLLLTIQGFIKIPISLLAGIITDKLGRRKTLFIFDVVSWGIPVLIWALSQNFWWFLAATIVNSLYPISTASWECLWLDETDEKEIGPIFDLVHISGLLAVLFAPFAGFFVANYGVVPVVRTIYIIAFIVMNLKFVLTYIFTYETEKGKQKMAETKDVRISKLLYSYKDVIKKIFKSRPMIRALSLQTSINIINVVISTFFALYITQNLEIGNEFLAFFPIISAVIQMIFLFFVQQRLNKFKSRNIMFGGILLYIIAILSLMLSPAQNLFFIGTYVLLQATANGLLQPRIQAINAAAIDPNDRARIRSIFMALSLGVTAPFGIIAGNLSELDRRFPFLLIIALLLFMIFQNVKRK